MFSFEALTFTFLFVIFLLASSLFYKFSKRANGFFKVFFVVFSLFALVLSLASLYYSFTFKQNEKQINQMGIYYLKNYKKHDSCILELKKDMTFEIRDKSKSYETGKWKYKSGDDYWITYLYIDKRTEQLGENEYEFYKFVREY